MKIKKIPILKIINTAIITVIIGLMIVPFFIMISTSLKSYAEVTKWPPVWLPDIPKWENFSTVWSKAGNIRIAFVNSLIVSLSTMLLCTVLGSFAAYSASRFKFAGKKPFLFGVIITQMFSAVILIGPMYGIIRDMGLLNTHLSLIIPNTAFSLPMTVWLLYGYLDGISPSLEEAAMLDGCTRLQAVTRILMPLLAPGIITSGLFAFIVSWNDLIFANSFITRTEMRTLSVALTSYRSLFETYWHNMMAASLISVIPVFVLFLMIQKYLVKGLSAGGVKE
ncbi:carbohydrate ABC transporter membrane protein 2, CUT1 family (plasmid) [Peptoclostridium acidaminophilum DSM 3953]|uniref:Carbohydrate ABC transporter membrane protein 2, CUT1 family n=1 Tax=Peptoclostridium acidaminophilum DSM 3953 TaxID=1286171 RepID=W8UAS3_PEPAC|nr:carbohydrate ABC transporter permease [Peptoclostridium acidaminophilum]AHM57901.1 carbohydrate ABC transporter membrane protein 2, CUT1 family [Peptoclostridium acidaminophilum DSM 3953]